MFCSKKQFKKVVPEGAFVDGAPDINFKAAESIYVNKLSGEKVKLSSIYEGKKTVMIFLRKFDCPTCYTYAMLFAYLQPILDKSDIRIVFFTCHDDLSEVHIFIRNFAYYLRNISVDGMKPLPGELYMDPTREAYKFFGLHNTLSKTDLYFLVYSLWWEKKLGLFKTDWKDGSKAYKPMSEHHAFLEIMNYIRTRMPVFIKKSGWEPESLLWQSPGICVVHENKLLYRYILKEQSKTLPNSPQSFFKEAFDLNPELIKDFSLKETMKGFVKVITNKGESARLKDKELVLGDKIGGGFESEVFKSTWLGTEVAVKYFRYSGDAMAFKSGESSTSYDSKNSNIKSFCNEVAIMMGLRHRNIITLMGFGISHPTQFIVMEYMPRGSLFDILGSKEILTPVMKSRFVTDIVDGLLYLHEGKPPILHQDLKSLNLLVAEDWTIKIADFGIARELKRPKASTEAMAEDTEESADHGGTLQWLAPECLAPEFSPSKEMDIYALGIVLWEIATRRRPWKGVKAKVIIESVLQGSRPKVYEEDKWGKEFTAIVQSAWAQDPAKRPTMKDLKKAITGKDIPCLS